MGIRKILRRSLGLWVPLSIAALIIGVGLFAPNRPKPRPEVKWSWAPAAIPRCRLSREAERARFDLGKCQGCHNLYPYDHSVMKRGYGALDLHSIYGERAGTHSLQHSHFYGPPLIAARDRGLVWTSENLEAYLRGPEAFLKAATGASNPRWRYMGVSIPGDDPRSVQRRRDIAEYFKEVKSQPCV